jgi:hypothetical protein
MAFQPETGLWPIPEVSPSTRWSTSTNNGAVAVLRGSAEAALQAGQFIRFHRLVAGAADRQSPSLMSIFVLTSQQCTALLVW